MAIGVQGQRLPPPQSPFPITVGSPPGPQTNGASAIGLRPGARSIIPPGNFMVDSAIAVVQVKDSISGLWFPVPTYSPRGAQFVNSDGTNFCVFNPTGSLVAAVVTEGGTNYSASAPPSVTISSGGGSAVAIVGGAIGSINFTVNASSVTSGVGSGYTYPPLVSIASPGSGGLQATAIAVIATLSGSTRLAQINILNQGAGYTGTTIPVQLVPNPDDPNLTSIINATVNATTTGATSVTAVVITNNGLGTLQGPPLLTIAAPATGTQAAAIAVPCLAATGWTQVAGGSGFGGFGAEVTIEGFPVQNSPRYTNPRYQQGFFQERQARFIGLTSGSGLGGITPEGAITIDNGLLASSSAVISVTGSALTVGAVIPPTGVIAQVGGVNANVQMQFLGGSA